MIAAQIRAGKKKPQSHNVLTSSHLNLHALCTTFKKDRPKVIVSASGFTRRAGATRQMQFSYAG